MWEAEEKAMLRIRLAQQDLLQKNAAGPTQSAADTPNSGSCEPKRLTCPMCDYQRSKEAATCPVCGLPFHTDSRRHERLFAVTKIAFGVLTGLGLLGVTLWLV